MTNLKYFAYLRKSSEEDAKQAQSIETQNYLLVEYSTKNQLEVVDFIAEQKSAKDDGNRPMFDSMLARLVKGEANAILVAHIDRLARNGIESGQLIKLFSKGVIKEIRTPSKSYNTIQDLLYLDIEFAFAADYSRRLSLRVKEGIQTKLRNGEYPRSAPLGYLNYESKIIPDPERAPLISEMFSEFATGNYSLFEITKYINDRGLRTKQARRRVVKSVVHRILTDPTYYGVIRYHDTLYPAVHQPLTTKALFDQAQFVLTGKKKRGNSHLSFLYRDYLTCAVCGCKLTATVKKSRYRYYYCTNGKGLCEQHRDYLPEPRIQKLISGVLADFALPGNLATTSLSLYIDDLQRHQGNGEQVMGALRNELATTELKLKRLEDMWLEGRISPERYDDRYKEISTAITQLKSQLRNYKPQNLQITLELLHKFKDQAVNIHEMFEDGNDEVKSELLKAALWNLEIKDGQVVSTRYKKPFAYFEGLSKCEDLSVWRRRWDSNPRDE